MHTRNLNFSKIFTKSLWEKSFDLFIKIAVVDEDELPILIVDRRDVSKEEMPNFPSPIPLPPYLISSGKEGCLPANTVEKFININGVPHEHEIPFSN